MTKTPKSTKRKPKESMNPSRNPYSILSPRQRVEKKLVAMDFMPIGKLAWSYCS